MPLLTAAALFVGSAEVDAVYLGSTQVWPTAAPLTHGWQIAANTALVGPAAGGFTSLTTITGDHTVTVDDTTVSGKLITGNLIINADDVLVEGCRVEGGIRHDTEFRGSTIRYCNVGGDDTYTDPGTAMVISPGFRLLEYSQAHNGADITRLVGSGGFSPVIQYNWLHTPEDASDVDPHTDLIQMSGGTGGGTIRGNFLDISSMTYTTTGANPPPGRRLTQIGNAAIICGDFWTDGIVTVENNLMIGGAYTCQFLDATAASNNSFVVTGNWFGSGDVVVSTGTESYPIFGPYSAGGSESGRFTWSGNQNAEFITGVWTVTGALSGP